MIETIEQPYGAQLTGTCDNCGGMSSFLFELKTPIVKKFLWIFQYKLEKICNTCLDKIEREL